MTAEVAILNKAAVALAADSAVTISNGDTSYKTFDSADKLFELSLIQPIGIMFYGNGQFCGHPIANLVRDFRSQSETFNTISEAGEQFLKFLHGIAKGSPQKMKELEYRRRILPVIQEIEKEVDDELIDRWMQARNEAEENKGEPPSVSEVKSYILIEKASALSDILSKYDDAKFIGGGRPSNLPVYDIKIFEEYLEHKSFQVSDDLISAVRRFAVLLVQKSFLSNGSLGIVIAGFGKDEKFGTYIRA